MDSILTTIKKLLGIEENYTHFDTDIIIGINSAFSTLHQLGVGPSGGFKITGATENWDEFLEDKTNIESVKTYVYFKVKLMFDSTSMGSATLASIERQISEYEWRLNVAADSGKESEA